MKGLISCAVTSVFAYAKGRFSHDVAHQVQSLVLLACIPGSAIVVIALSQLAPTWLIHRDLTL